MKTVKQFFFEYRIYFLGALTPFILLFLIFVLVEASDFVGPSYSALFEGLLYPVGLLFTLLIAPISVFIEYLFDNYDLQINYPAARSTLQVSLSIISGIIYSLVLNRIWKFVKKSTSRISEKKQKFVRLIVGILILILFMALGDIVDRRFSKVGGGPLHQTCLSAPGSKGCRSCQSAGEYVDLNKDGNFYVIEDISEDYTEDAEKCAMCENQYQEGYSFKDLDEACRDPE